MLHLRVPAGEMILTSMSCQPATSVEIVNADCENSSLEFLSFIGLE
ncbi:hypothetical protein [Methanobrevibacter sp.]